MPLRNFTHMSVVRGGRVFDEVVTPHSRGTERLAVGDPDLQDDELHVLDESLRRRQRTQPLLNRKAGNAHDPRAFPGGPG